MKKTSILIAMFAVIAAASTAKAQGGDIDFDGKVANGGSIVAILQMSGPWQNDKMPLPAPGLEKGMDSDIKVTPVPTLKEFMAGLRQEDRTEFLDGLTLVNGHLALGGVRQTDTDGKILRVKDLLKDVPADTEKEFMESMAFKDGLFVSAYVGGLRRVMGDKSVKSVIASLTPDTNARASMADSKSLCMGGSCDNATCCYNGSGYGCYDTFADSTCTSSCK